MVTAFVVVFLPREFKKLARDIRGVVLRLFADPTQERWLVISQSLAIQRATGWWIEGKLLPNLLKFHGQ